MGCKAAAGGAQIKHENEFNFIRHDDKLLARRLHHKTWHKPGVNATVKSRMLMNFWAGETSARHVRVQPCSIGWRPTRTEWAKFSTSRVCCSRKLKMRTKSLLRLSQHPQAKHLGSFYLLVTEKLPALEKICRSPSIPGDLLWKFEPRATCFAAEVQSSSACLCYCPDKTSPFSSLGFPSIQVLGLLRRKHNNNA